jgi:UDP-2-acetamido-2-deoxy-ribo-hexuluronate aminotransferase
LDILLSSKAVVALCTEQPSALKLAVDRAAELGHTVWLYAGYASSLPPSPALTAFCDGKQWLAALAGDTDLGAADVEAEQLQRAVSRFKSGHLALLGAPSEARYANTAEQYLAVATKPAPIEFIDLKAQQHAIRASLERNLHRVMHHGQYILGAEIEEMERKLAAYTGSKHCISCASGTEALLMSLMALGIGPGDEVITTPFTFAATAEMIVLAGAKPVFVDIEADTGLMDATQIEAKINARTKAIMPVSLYGQVADMNAINAIAAKHGNIPVIEDAAQSFGASYWGFADGKVYKSCNLSTIGCTSFFPSKPLGCYGDGGALFTNDDALAQALREIRVHGQSKRYHHSRIGVGGRMDTVQAAVILAKLERFEWEIEQRKRLGDEYAKALANTDVRLLAVRPDRDCVWAQYSLFVNKREALQAALKAQGIPTAVHYPVPINLQPAYAHLCCPDCMPESVKAGASVMSLPMSPDLSGVDLLLSVRGIQNTNAE